MTDVSLTPREETGLLTDKQNIFIVKSQEERAKNLTVVAPEIFDKMKTDQGPTVSDFTSKGLKVVLFFTRALTCPFCLGTMEDIYVLHDTLYKLNTIVIVMYQEHTQAWDEYLKTNEKFKILYCMPQRLWKKYFGLTSQSLTSTLSPSFLSDVLSTQKSLKKFGVSAPSNRFTDVGLNDHLQLAAIFVVQNNKIISEVRKQKSTDRFDLARIVIDPDQFGIEIHTSIFACDRPRKPKVEEKKRVVVPQKYLGEVKKTKCFKPVEDVKNDVRRDFKLEEVMQNSHFKSYFKLHMSKEFAVENMIFLEEVETYRQLPDEQRKQISKQIFESFLVRNSEYELNVSEDTYKSLEKKLNDESVGDVDFFKELVAEITRDALIPSFGRFLSTDLVIEMQKPKLIKQRALMVGI